jgi:hypothetical protein
VLEQVNFVGGYPKIMDGSGASANILSSGVAACQSSILPIDRVLMPSPAGAATSAMAPVAPTTPAAQVAAAG